MVTEEDITKYIEAMKIIAPKQVVSREQAKSLLGWYEYEAKEDNKVVVNASSINVFDTVDSKLDLGGFNPRG